MKLMSFEADIRPVGIASRALRALSGVRAGTITGARAAALNPNNHGRKEPNHET
jgi:hypothetical protein